MGQGPWQQRTQKRLKYWMPSLQSLVVKTCPWEYQATKNSGKVLMKEVEKNLLKEHFNKLDKQKSGALMRCTCEC